jgi:hypothetical protein
LAAKMAVVNDSKINATILDFISGCLFSSSRPAGGLF